LEAAPRCCHDSGDSLEGADNSNLSDNGCSFLEAVGHCVQQAVLWLALFYFVHVIGVLQVMVWVPFHMLCTFYTAPTAGDALTKNTAYMKRVLVMGLFSNVVHLLLQAYVLPHVLQYLPLEQMEAAILKCIPKVVLDTYRCLSNTTKLYLE
jgi:hypothetical protein